MKLKLTCVMIIISLVMLSFVGVGISATDQEYNNNDADNYLKISSQEEQTKTLSQGEDEILVTTTGPIAPILDITDITFIDGSFCKIFLINWIIENNFFTIRPRISIDVKDMTFIIQYTKKVLQGPIFQRYSYETIVEEDGNESVYTEKHTLIVSGFTGTFEFSRRKPIRLTPAFFTFVGVCDDVIVTT